MNDRILIFGSTNPLTPEITMYYKRHVHILPEIHICKCIAYRTGLLMYVSLVDSKMRRKE